MHAILSDAAITAAGAMHDPERPILMCTFIEALVRFSVYRHHNYAQEFLLPDCLKEMMEEHVLPVYKCAPRANPYDT